ncbi:GOLPH3/VPS74 family protein [Nocardioides sp.]|uniref:GOLPH3/VPS74 family protein n=1 Tax=Nocardioides sp. TaxID=35761 RepID=UPI002ED3EE60
METLIAEDLLLLLLDDEKGTLSSSYERPLLGGALLVELSLGGQVEVEHTRILKTARARVTGQGGTPGDPLLADALAVVAEKPRSAQQLVDRLGKSARQPLLDQLVDRGLVERRTTKVLGLFPRTTWPAADARHEAEVRQRLQAALVEGREADPRTATLAALLAAVDRAHTVVDRGAVPARTIKKRAKELGEGQWASEAARASVQASQAAVMAAVTASTAGAVVSSGS